MQTWRSREFREAARRAFQRLVTSYNLPAHSYCVLLSYSPTINEPAHMARLGRTPGDGSAGYTIQGALERAQRLAGHIADGHTSSRMSRSEEQDKLGGAILVAEDLIFSPMGLGEALDEALAILVARELCGDTFSLDEARRIASYTEPATNIFALRLLEGND